MIIPIPPDRSSTIREIRAIEMDDGCYANVEFHFARGGGERHPFVIAEDLQAVLDAGSIGKAYWQVCRKKYKTPTLIEKTVPCGAWIAGDDGALAAACANAVPCEVHQEERNAD